MKNPNHARSKRQALNGNNGIRQPYTMQRPEDRTKWQLQDESPTKPFDPESPYDFVQTRATTNYFIVPRIWFLTPLNKLDVLFLQDLMNRASANKTVWDEERIWFKCTINFLARDGLGWSRDEQQTRFKSLRDKGLLETKLIGMPGLRWVKLNSRKLRKLIKRARKKLHNRGETAPCAEHA